MIRQSSLSTFACLMIWATVTLFISCPALHAADVQLIPTTVQPGECFVIRVAPAPGKTIAEVKASVLNQEPVFFQRAHTYKALGAVRASAKPGPARVYIKVFYTDGESFQDILPFRVLSRSFPTQNIRMSQSKTGLMDPGLLKREREYLYPHLADSRQRPLWTGRFIAPSIGRNVSSFGRRRYVNGKWWGQHSGADIACGQGAPVKADNDGFIVVAERLDMRGNTVVIDHGFNLFTLYNHLSHIAVRVGDAVRKGDGIGKVGATGFVTGPHLHWEIRVGTIPVNPWTWTKEEADL